MSIPRQERRVMKQRIKLYAVSVAAMALAGGLGITSVASAAIARGPGHGGNGYSSAYGSNSNNRTYNDTTNYNLNTTVQTQDGVELAQNSQTSSPGSGVLINQNLIYTSYINYFRS
jgi:hypothetical protein